MKCSLIGYWEFCSERYTEDYSSTHLVLQGDLQGQHLFSSFCIIEQLFIKVGTLSNENWLCVPNVYTGPQCPTVVGSKGSEKSCGKETDVTLLNPEILIYIWPHDPFSIPSINISWKQFRYKHINSWNCLERITSTYWWIGRDYLKQNYWSHIWDKICLRGLSGLFLDLCK